MMEPEDASPTDACEVHHQPFVEAPVRIAYGLFSENSPLAQASAEFPHWKRPPLGGCCISDDGPKTEAVRYCPACEEAKLAWERKNSR